MRVWVKSQLAGARPLAVALLAFASTAAAQTPTRTETAITGADMRARIAFLASDALRGRDTPSPGLEQAAAYIAAEFKAFGLQPAGDSGTFLQRWTYTKRELTAAGVSGELRAGDSRQTLSYLKDFFVLPGAEEKVSGNVIFAGTAGGEQLPIVSTARGQILAYYIAGTKADNEWLQRVMGVLPIAMMSGAKALVLILDPGFGADQIAWVSTQAAGQQLPIMLAAIGNAAATQWITRAGGDLEKLRTAGGTLEGATIELAARIESTPSRPPNVVALLPGSDPVLKDTYIVFSAHMDHVGVGAPDATGDSIFNGADDDASGTSAVLEVAQAFAAMSPRPKRSILFVTVSGEEKGLYGSAHFVQQPPVPASKMVANINMDMIGRNHPDTVVAIGQEYSTLGPLAQQIGKANADLRLTIAPDLWPEERLFFRSDHFNFARAGVAAIFFTTGLHADYHQPSDEPETIDNEKAARIARLVFQLGKAIADSPDAPKWTDQGIAAMRAISGGMF